MVNDGQVIEGGTYNELMESKGHLSKLVGEHVITEKNLMLEEINKARMSSSSLTAIEERCLTPRQMENRLRVSMKFKTYLTDDALASKIESNQLRMTVHPIVQKNLSIISKIEPDEPVPEDADPLKLVLEDQSIYYHENPLISYMKAGRGSIVSVVIVVMFFLVHLVRIGSGKKKIMLIYNIKLC